MADNKVVYGVIAVFSVLFGAGASFILSPEQVQLCDSGKCFVCSSNDNFGVFQGFVTVENKTGFWINETGGQQRATCRNGFWEPLNLYLARTGKTLDQLRPLLPDSEPAPARARNFTINKVCEQVPEYYNAPLFITYNKSYRNNVTGQNVAYQEVFQTAQQKVRMNTVCRQLSVSTEEKIEQFHTLNRNCWQQADVYCCVALSDGGANYLSRGGEYKLKIHSGECGYCKNATTGETLSEGSCAIGVNAQ